MYGLLPHEGAFSKFFCNFLKMKTTFIEEKMKRKHRHTKNQANKKERHHLQEEASTIQNHS